MAVPISAPNADLAADQIDAAVDAGAEILEFRIDYLEGLTPEKVVEILKHAQNGPAETLPIIVTCRDKKQGGAIQYPLKLRIDVLAAALRAGADFIDFEYENYLEIGNQERLRRALSMSRKGRLILSHHDFKGRFPDITALHRRISTVCSSAIPKLVYTAKNINDCFDALDLLEKTGGDRIAFCMGPAGLISRILTKKLGSFLTFAGIDEKSTTAPGQLTVDEFKRLYRGDAIDPETRLFGVIADPVAHSLSPAIHNACFEHQHMNSLYLPLLVEGGSAGFDRFMRNIILRKWLHFRGLSVTIPHKHNALAFVKAAGGTLEPLAEKIGAVNTLIITAHSGLKAYNTDYAGALDAVTAGMGIPRSDIADLPVAVVGAGGVARAIVAGLADAGAKIKIYNRTLAKAEALAAEFNCDAAGLDGLTDLAADLLINCTSIGMHPNTGESPIPAESLKAGMTVFDTVYNPAETLLLKQAKQAGARTIDGIAMFVNQALAQFKLFTGQNANPKIMRETICRNLHNP
ncbi:MAG: shikimate dehydrogenase [Sedimentisphaerales bacterium]|nr:shikimate dehydrogenase [Sedimentisphaerales bacterium]